MRNCGIGKRSRLPVVQMPVVSSLTMSASSAGGVPPILGALTGQSELGLAGRYGSGPPCSQLARSGFPLLSLGVWHCPHMATPSTRYFPRTTSDGRPVFSLLRGGALLCDLVSILLFSAKAGVTS